MDKVSIIITCCDLESYLEECINSIKAQTKQPNEILLLHDGCRKPTTYTSVHTSFREKNIGVAGTRDEGVRLSIGNYLLFIDADDVLVENYLEEMLRVIAHADVAYPNALLWSSWGESSMKNIWHETDKKMSFKKLFKTNQIYLPSLMKRSVYSAIGRFDGELPMYEDWKFWLEALEKGFKFSKANTFFKYRQRTKGRNRQSDELKKDTFARIRSQFIIKPTK